MFFLYLLTLIDSVNYIVLTYGLSSHRVYAFESDNNQFWRGRNLIKLKKNAVNLKIYHTQEHFSRLSYSMHLIFTKPHFYVQKVAMHFCKITHQSSDAKYWCLDNNYYLSQEDLITVFPVQKVCCPDTVSWDILFPHQSKVINTHKVGLAEIEWLMKSLHLRLKNQELEEITLGKLQRKMVRSCC